MMKRTLTVFLLLIGSLCHGQTIENGGPQAAGFSADRLRRIDVAMNDWVNKGWMNGAAALIVRNGQIAYYNAAGFNDLETRTPLDKTGIFRIASQTKAITSVAIMMLYDEGKLLITDPVSKYIPTFKGQKVLVKLNPDTTYTTEPAKREVTIKDLLTHTSGIGYAMIGSRDANAIYHKFNLTAGIGPQRESLVQAMTRLGEAPLMHQPGARWTYGLNTDLLGAIVEIVSGLSLEQFLTTRLFEPLGMKDTYFTVPQSKADRLVNLYTEIGGRLEKAKGENMLNGRVLADYPLRRTTYFSGGAGLSSTLYDYAIFLQMLINEGVYNGKRVLGRNTVRMMTMNQIGELSNNGDKFGLGFQIATENGSAANSPVSPGTFSWGGAFATSYWADPKEKIVMLLYRQLQVRSHNEVTEMFKALTYQALEK